MEEEKVSKRTNIQIDVALNEHHVPLALHWKASDGAGEGPCKAVLLSMWDPNEENAMRIDLWNKEMSIFDMQRFFHQTLMTMGDTYERATGHKDHAEDIRRFAKQFAERTGIMG